MSNETIEDFERWAKDNDINLFKNKETDVYYFHPSTQYAFEMWQAALSSSDFVPRAEVDKLVDVLRNAQSSLCSVREASPHTNRIVNGCIGTLLEAIANFEKQP